MSYTTLSVAAISLAFVAVALAGATAILVVLRRRRWADRASLLAVAALILAGVSALGAAVQSQRDLQAQTRRVLSLAASAERAVHARSGRYTYSIATLERFSPGLAFEIQDHDARIQASVGRRSRSVHLRASLGFETSGAYTVRSTLSRPG